MCTTKKAVFCQRLSDPHPHPTHIVSSFNTKNPTWRFEKRQPPFQLNSNQNKKQCEMQSHAGAMSQAPPSRTRFTCPLCVPVCHYVSLCVPVWDTMQHNITWDILTKMSSPLCTPSCVPFMCSLHLRTLHTPFACPLRTPPACTRQAAIQHTGHPS